MPIVIEQPRLLNPAVSALSAQTGVALVVITGLLKAPPDQPNLPLAIKNVLRCLEAMLMIQPQVANALEFLMRELAVAVRELNGKVELDQPAAMFGRSMSYRAWALCTSDFTNALDSLLQMIGVEVARAYLTQGVFTAALAENLQPLVNKVHCEELSQVEKDWLTKAVLRQVERARHVFTDRALGLDAHTTSFNARVTASLVAQKSSLRIEERQAAGRVNEMTEPELACVTEALKARVIADDAEALQIGLAFCIGLTFEICMSIPFFTGARSPTVVWINPIEGCIYVDMERVLSGLSQKQTDRHVKTSLLLVRPLPLFIAEFLHRACAATPGLENIGDITNGKFRFSRAIVPSADNESAIRSSVARLIASRGGAALRSGIPRDLAAYATLSISLISKSDHHYLTKQRSEIWSAGNKLYTSLGWGKAVPDPDVNGPAFGSRVTPELEWVKVVLAEQSEKAIRLRPGKRYRLESIVEHHNAFASYVSLLMRILIGGRNRKAVDFRANVWADSHVFGQHSDKPVGPTEGLTPLPIPVTLSNQLKLWSIHLIALDRRLEKLGFTNNHPTRMQIRAILRGESVDLIFALNEHGLAEQLHKDDIFKGEAKNLNGDFSRHFIPGLLSEQGVPFEQTQSWLRHHVDGIAASSITATTVPQVWLSNVASALDRISLNLGLRPVHGISKEI